MNNLSNKWFPFNAFDDTKTIIFDLIYWIDCIPNLKDTLWFHIEPEADSEWLENLVPPSNFDYCSPSHLNLNQQLISNASTFTHFQSCGQILFEHIQQCHTNNRTANVRGAYNYSNFVYRTVAMTFHDIAERYQHVFEWTYHFAHYYAN